MSRLSSNQNKQNKHPLLGLLMLTLLLLSFLFSKWAISPPVKLGAEEPEANFSACRAYKHLEAISKAPRPTGSDENQRVREYLIAALQKLGYEVHLQETTAYSYRRIPVYGQITNIIARLPGTKGDKAVMVVGHHDTQPHTPGAADNGIAIASMLEAAAVFKENAPLKNDLILLFTDSEEVGLLGANAFVNEHPLAEKVGLVINLEARGNSGPALAFEVSEQNGWIIREFMRSAKHPVASSLMYEVYKQLPNDTDFTVFKQAGMAGINIALIEGFTHYHSPTDRPENLNINSIQHIGSYVVSLVTHFGNLSLHQNRADDLVYFNVAGFYMLSYPLSWNAGILVLLTLLFALQLYLAIRKQKLRLQSFLYGLVALLASLIITIGAVWLVNTLVLRMYPHYAVFYSHTFYNAPFYYYAYMLLVSGLFFTAYAFMFKRLQKVALFLPGMLILLLLSAFISFKLPTASYILNVPLLLMFVASLLVYGLKRFRASILIEPLAAMAVIWLLGPVVFLVFHIFGPGMVIAGAALMFYLLFMMLPGLAIGLQTLGYKPAVASFVLVFVLLGAAHLQSGYDMKKPLQSNVMYAADQVDNKAYWLSRNMATDAWNKQFFEQARPDSIPDFYPGSGRVYLKAAAPFLPYKKPSLSLTHDTLIQGNRIIEFSMGHFNHAFMLEVIIDKKATVKAFSINGKPAHGMGRHAQHRPFQLVRIVNPGQEKIHFSVVLEGSSLFSFSLLERIIGLPEKAHFEPMPLEIVPDSDYESMMSLIRHEWAL